MKNKNADIEEIIRRTPLYGTGKNISIQELPGGVTNSNYLIEIDRDRYVLRISGTNTSLLGIDRRQEYHASSAAANAGLAPEVIYFMEAEGHLITRFIDGRHWSWEEIRHPSTIQRAVSVFKRIHTLPSIDKIFSPYKDIDLFQSTIHSLGIQPPNDIQIFLDRMTVFAMEDESDPSPAHFCHNDLVRRNFIDDGLIWVIDWEYAGMGDIFYDLATFSTNHEFNTDQEMRLLTEYFGIVSYEHISHLQRMKYMFLLREAMWALVQSGASTSVDFDYRDYSVNLFSRLAAF